MNVPLSRQDMPNALPPTHDAMPQRLIVTVSVITFALRDWALWVLLREGMWGPPMRLVTGNESVTDAVQRTLHALLIWPDRAAIMQLKAGWQEQQVHIWGNSEQGAAVSLIHSILLRANHDVLHPDLHLHPIPSLHVTWVPVAEVESGQRSIDADVLPALQIALHTLRSQVQRDPEIVLRYLADMGMTSMAENSSGQEHQESVLPANNDTQAAGIFREPEPGSGMLTLAEAALLYRAFFSSDEQIDLSNLRRRFLATNRLVPLEEERPVRGREQDWRRVSRAYRYFG